MSRPDPVLTAIETAGKAAVSTGDTALASALRHLWQQHKQAPITPAHVDQLDRSSQWWENTPVGAAVTRLRAAVAASGTAPAPTRPAAIPAAPPPAAVSPHVAAMLAQMQLTDEQTAALTLFVQGARIIALQAGAGTGKTHTLRALAQLAALLNKSGVYTAFGKAIVREAKTKMPRNVRASTAHSLAFKTVGIRYEHRLNSGRMRAREIARRLGITQPFIVKLPTGARVLQPYHLANMVQRAINRFCQSADPEPGEQHFEYVDGIDPVGPDGRRGWANNRDVRAHLRRHLATMWDDLTRLDGQFPFEHGHYFKIWQLTPDGPARPGPYIPADFVLVDEAQDLSPALMDVVLRNRGHAQLVFVGDSMQSIMAFTGAVDALSRIPADATAYLTHSFRFGPAIAEVANRVLDALNADLRITGAGRPGTVGPIAQPDAVLCRTNAAAVDTVMAAQKAGRRPWLVGGGADVARFAEAAISLRDTGTTYHPELVGFTAWQQVQDFVANDEGGTDLKRLVQLVDDNGPEEILAALGNMPDVQPPDADLVASTVHKAKGLQWPRVKVSGDGWRGEFSKISEEDLMLLYVAVTRAEVALDVTAIECLNPAAAPARHLQVVA